MTVKKPTNAEIILKLDEIKGRIITNSPGKDNTVLEMVESKLTTLLGDITGWLDAD